MLHLPVMLIESLKYLAPRPDQHFLDCTFGAGGFSRALLDACQCQVTALDQDPGVLSIAGQLAAQYVERFKFLHTSFAASPLLLKPQQFDGIVMDLGVSTMQLDNGQRGFSFSRDGPLDMRMSQSGLGAADFVNQASEAEIAQVIYQYGDEVASRRIAQKIVAQRQIKAILTTGQLASIVRSSIGFRPGRIDSATKTFQAIRIHVNNELGQLKEFLASLTNLLKPAGRLVIISFHALEDRIVKEFFKAHSLPVIAQSKYAKKLPRGQPDKWLKIITKRPLSPSAGETKLNPRSRSAKFRAAIRRSVHDAD